MGLIPRSRGPLWAATHTAKSLRKFVNFYQIFTNKPEDWHLWRSARSEGGGAVRNALNRMEATREIACLQAEIQTPTIEMRRADGTRS
jgi:hypothetical protein